MTFADPDVMRRNTPPPGAGTVCNGCGDCCDPVILTAGQLDRMYEHGRWYLEYAYTDDELAEVASENGRTLEEQRSLTEAHRRDATFALGHWWVVGHTANGNDEVVCDRFDAINRVCRAHDDRPPICRNYPWYGEQPNEERARHLPARCSFRSDPLLLQITPKPT